MWSRRSWWADTLICMVSVQSDVRSSYNLFFVDYSLAARFFLYYDKSLGEIHSTPIARWSCISQGRNQRKASAATWVPQTEKSHPGVMDLSPTSLYMGKKNPGYKSSTKKGCSYFWHHLVHSPCKLRCQHTMTFDFTREIKSSESAMGTWAHFAVIQCTYYYIFFVDGWIYD